MKDYSGSPKETGGKKEGEEEAAVKEENKGQENQEGGGRQTPDEEDPTTDDEEGNEDMDIGDINSWDFLEPIEVHIPHLCNSPKVRGSYAALQPLKVDICGTNSQIDILATSCAVPSLISEHNAQEFLRLGAECTIDSEMHSDDILSLSGDNNNGSVWNQPIVDVTDNDDSRSSLSFEYVIMNISRLKTTVYSETYMIRNLPWRLMIQSQFIHKVMNNVHEGTEFLAVYLQCGGIEGVSNWSCKASFRFCLLNHRDEDLDIVKAGQYVFCSNSNDRGYKEFIRFDELLYPDEGYSVNDCITLKVQVEADIPHGLTLDSKRLTGYVGLRNQGATCYMNSLLQTLYFTNELRKTVYQMVTDSLDSTKCVVLALQRVFYDLQFSSQPVGTSKLTTSFGWNSFESFRQHDVQELCRVLLDKLESSMRGTVFDGTIPRLFGGRMTSYIKCRDVDYESKQNESFYDIQLNVSNKANVYESFEEYTAIEVLQGENKYDAGDLGFCDAEKGVKFQHFPPVLHLQLLRFHYDPVSNEDSKINDRFAFPERLELDKYLDESAVDVANPANYMLQAVLMHNGDINGGHYVVFINPKGDGQWFKFNDDIVSHCTRTEAMEDNYGGQSGSGYVHGSAYMLVYIRESRISTVLAPVTEDDIPDYMIEKFQEVSLLEEQERKEKSEAHLYFQVHVFTDDMFDGHQGVDLFNTESAKYRVFRVAKASTLTEFLELIAKALKYDVKQLRPWELVQRPNQAFRPTLINVPKVKELSMRKISQNEQYWPVYIETVEPESLANQLPAYNEYNDVIIFLKKYDPKMRSITYCGHIYMPISAKICDFLIPILKERGRFSTKTQLILFEEVRPHVLEEIKEWSLPIESVLEELVDGDIIVFQAAPGESGFDVHEWATAKGYFSDLTMRTTVTFIDRTLPNDRGFTLELSLNDNYDAIANAVAIPLATHPYLILFLFHHDRRLLATNQIACTFDGQLRDLFLAHLPKEEKKLFYQLVNVRINELENRQQFKCLWVNTKLKEEKELILYLSKSSHIKDLYEEALKLVTLSKHGSGKLRLLEVKLHKIHMLHEEVDMPLENLTYTDNKIYRLEEIPNNELDIAEDEILVPVVHFQAELISAFGVPFLMKIKDKLKYSELLEQIRIRLEVSRKEFDTYKLAVGYLEKLMYINDTNECISIKNFLPPSPQESAIHRRPWLGLDHINKAAMTLLSISEQEKAIKIHN